MRLFITVLFQVEYVVRYQLLVDSHILSSKFYLDRIDEQQDIFATSMIKYHYSQVILINFILVITILNVDAV